MSLKIVLQLRRVYRYRLHENGIGPRINVTPVN